jgi:hypothetical protein
MFIIFSQRAALFYLAMRWGGDDKVVMIWDSLPHHHPIKKEGAECIHPTGLRYYA